MRRVIHGDKGIGGPRVGRGSEAQAKAASTCTEAIKDADIVRFVSEGLTQRRRKELGGAMRQRRTELGKSQADIAGKAGLTREFYLAVEAGSRNISVDNAFAIADALDIHPSALFGAIKK
ncbi:transcriptional regulator, y4mF family [Mycobacteroides abscessus subsp. abscessus]|nr:transcriptional regulator, y4mF family [Mycobacteroides abscessus subsp. abscessus]